MAKPTYTSKKLGKRARSHAEGVYNSDDDRMMAKGGNPHQDDEYLYELAETCCREGHDTKKARFTQEEGG